MTTKAKKAEPTQDERPQEIGRCAMSSIAEMVAALECDYDRLEELKDERDGYEPDDAEERAAKTGEANSAAMWAADNPEEAAELAELIEAAGECESREDAEQRIQEDPLSLQFRSGWVGSKDEMEPEEFELLLGTGGPAVRIVGEIRDGQAHRPRLQTQDWGTAWTDYYESDTTATLETYCGVFCFEF
jgi:hypothetical protein